MQEEYGGCDCEVNTCWGGPAYDSPEGKERRYKGLNQLRMLAHLQIVLSAASLVIGLASIGVAAVNPNYPQINGYAVATGIMVLIGSLLARKAAVGDCVDGISVKHRTFITVHYVMNITCLTFSVLQIVFTSVAMSQCFTTDPQKCAPYLTVNEVLDIMLVVLGVALFITCFYGTIFFFMYARVFGFTNRYDRMRQEIDTLRQEVQAQQNNTGEYTNNGYSSFGSKTPL